MRKEKTMPEPKQVYRELLEVMKARRGGYAGMVSNFSSTLGSRTDWNRY